MATFLGAHVPSDLVIKSMHTVRPAELNQIVGADANLPIVRNENQDVFLRVNLTTKVDLLRYIAERPFESYRLSATAYFCDKPDALTRLTIPGVYKNGRLIGWGNNRKNEKSTREFGEPSSEEAYDYDVVIFGKLQMDWKVNPGEVSFATKNQKIYRRYDFLDKPEDVCVRLLLSTIALVIRSNEVRISKDQLEQALSGFQP